MFFCHQIVCCCVITLTIDVESNSRANNITNNNIFLSSHPKRRSKIKWSKGEEKKGIKTHIFCFSINFSAALRKHWARRSAHTRRRRFSGDQSCLWNLFNMKIYSKISLFWSGHRAAAERDGTSPMTRLMWFFGVKTDDEGEDDARVRWCVYLNGCKNWGEWWRESSRSMRWWWWDISPRVERP